MLKYTDTEVVFKEVPDEITLAINISGCPIHCPGCHSKELWEDIGDPLTPEALFKLLDKNHGVSCVALMGGDREPAEISRLAGEVKARSPFMKVAWYSGKEEVSRDICLDYFDYMKLGPYIESLGGLDKPGTNQVFYRVGPDKELIDITERFIKG